MQEVSNAVGMKPAGMFPGPAVGMTVGCVKIFDLLV
jgi:hypothetical protein